jgi:hypothetical protein
MGILAVMVVFGLTLNGCGDGDDGSYNSKFQGSWRATVEGETLTLVFSGKEWAAIVRKITIAKGTFTFTATTKIITTTHTWNGSSLAPASPQETATSSYTISGNTLKTTFEGETETFTKI